MDKAVNGATKPKCMYPKQKYLDIAHVNIPSRLECYHATTMQLVLTPGPCPWVNSFSSVVWRFNINAKYYANHERITTKDVKQYMDLVHLLMRSNAGNDVLSYCASQRGILSAAYKGGTHSGQAGTIQAYTSYLNEKIHVYGEVQRDLVRTGVQGRDGFLRNLPVSKGLLHYVSALQKQIGALLDCKFYVDELSNEVTIGAFALLVQDLLRLFQAMNEGVINILQNFFEMTKDQARLGLQIYKTFAEQTTKAVEYFSVAKRMERVIHTDIPQLKHAPLSLVRTLEEYVNSPDFEEGQASVSKSKTLVSSKSAVKSPSTTKTTTTSTPAKSTTSTSAQAAKDDDDIWTPKKTTDESKRLSTKKDMIDFFSSIDNEETAIVQSPNDFQAQMLAGNDFQQFQLQLQQQQQLFQMQQQQLQAQQNMMLQAQPTGFATDMLTAQQTGFNTNPFSQQFQQQPQPTGMMNNGNDFLGLMGANSMGMNNMNAIAPQSTGNPFRMGSTTPGSAASLMTTPSLPMMTGPTHFNSMPSLASQPTGAVGTNPFMPSSNPLNPFSPNYGKLPAQPTGVM
ncbi:hypothetical protein BGW38_010262, partial [Lunasporangiospora selenospora]